MPAGLPFRLNDYLELVDWSGRILREDKKGAIPEELPAILLRLQLDTRNWCYLTRNFEHPFTHLVGAAHHVRRACETIGQRWAKGISQCEHLFSSAWPERKIELRIRGSTSSPLETYAPLMRN